MDPNYSLFAKFFYWLLSLFCRAEVLEIVAGDLLEMHEYQRKKSSRWKADLYFARDVFSLFRLRLMKSLKGTQKLNYYDMFQHNFKVARRNLVRNRSHSFLNIVGLAVGMSCSILILLWIQNELSYDRFHEDSSKIYRITVNVDGAFKAAVTPPAMGAAVQEELPEVDDYVRISKTYDYLLDIDDRLFEKQLGYFVEANFLDFFDFPLVEGSKVDVLKDPDGILITKTAARRYFGKADAMGKTIKVDNQDHFIVKGILEDVPSSSHLQFDFLLPLSHLAKTNQDLATNSWGSFNYHSYVKVQHEISSKEGHQVLESKMTKFVNDLFSNAKMQFQLQPLADIHLYSDLQIDVPGHGNAQYVQIFVIVSLFILIIACINFMNLATAKSAKRAKEVGIRKVVGVNRWQLIKQFLLESTMVSFLSVTLAVVIVYLALPSFNGLIGKQLDISWTDSNFLFILVGIALLTGLLSGSYPSLFLSSFKPIKVLKGSMVSGKKGQLFRNTLVVVQFFVSITLLVGVAVVYDQLHYIQHKNLGFDKSNLLYVPLTAEIRQKQETFKNLLDQNPVTSRFTYISELPTEIVAGTLDVRWEGKDPDLSIVIPDFTVDHRFEEVFQAKIIHGRSFAKELVSDSSSLVINEKMAEVMGLTTEEAIGKKIFFQGWKTIIGVVENFNFKPLQYAIEPLVLNIDNNQSNGYYVIKTVAGENQQAIEYLKEIYEEFSPGQPLAFGFVDQELENLYRGEQQMGQIFNLFGVLAIFISCLGLYGLAAFVAEQHTKELGIRKVLGANVWSLMNLLSKGFVRLVLLAAVISLPISWYFMNQWLAGFAYHTSISAWTLAGACLVTLLITLLTVSHQIIKATRANPVHSLRSE